MPTKTNMLIIDHVRANPGVTRRELEAWMLANRRARSGPYVAGGSYLHQRLARLCKNGQLHKIVSRGSARYFAPDAIPAAFDLSVQTDRLVAADFVQEQGDEATANLLRRAVRGSAGRKEAT